MSLANLLNQTGTLQSVTNESDLSSGMVRSWTTVLTGEPIRVEDASAKEIEAYAANGVEITHKVFCLTNTPESSWRWVYDGRNFIIKSILRRRAIGNIESFYINMCSEAAPSG